MMTWLRRLWARARRMADPEGTSRDLRDELDFHLEMETRDLIASGMEPREARRRAHVTFGGVEQYRERSQEAVGFVALDHVWRDLRLAARQLRRRPGFATVVVLTLGLGVGVTTAVFSVAHAVLLRPLPYPDADRLVTIWLDVGGNRQGMTDGSIFDLAERTDLFESIGRSQGPQGAHLVNADGASRVPVLYASGAYFETLGMRPLLGRAFAPEDAYETAILTHATWRQMFGGDPAVVGRTADFHGRAFRIVGVAPADFRVPIPGDVAAFRNLPDPEDPDRVWFRNRAVGRLAPGVSLPRARQELEAFTARQRERRSDWATRDISVRVEGLQSSLVADVRPTLLLLFATAGVVLLIACANIANLLLVRAESRGHETAVRRALGAGRSRLAGQHLAEALVLGILGGAAGLALAAFALPVLTALRPEEFQALDVVQLDGSVLAIGALLTGVALLVFAAAPVLHAWRHDPASSLRTRGEGRPSRLRAGGLLVVGEVAMSVALLVGAGLLGRSLQRLIDEDPGFVRSGALTFSVNLPASDYDRPSHVAFFDELEVRLAALPGVSAVGSAWPFPLRGGFTAGYAVSPEQREAGDIPVAQHVVVTSGYARAMGLEIVQGRFYEPDDPKEVVVVDERLAEIAFPGESALGKTISVANWGGPGDWATIVGVVRNVRYRGFRGEGRETVYLLWRNFAWTNQSLTVAVATGLPPLSLVEPAQRILREMDSRLPMADVQSVEGLLAEDRSDTTFAATLMAVFAALAALLASIGLYGVIAYDVSQRRYEFGLRLALGAERRGILGLVLSQGLKMSAIGVALGLITAAALGRGLGALLFGVAPLDPATLVAVTALVLSVAVLAAYLPARRATVVDPARTLRAE